MSHQTALEGFLRRISVALVGLLLVLASAACGGAVATPGSTAGPSAAASASAVPAATPYGTYTEATYQLLLGGVCDLAGT